jgi:hypothetical protein
MIVVKASGNTKHLDDFIKKMQQADFFNLLDRYGAIGVAALANATPVDSGLTAASWTYEVTHKRGRHSIVWHNTNVNDGKPVAILIQYGHGTGTGGYVVGRDFINPVIKPLFDMIADEIWEKVKRG